MSPGFPDAFCAKTGLLSTRKISTTLEILIEHLLVQHRQFSDSCASLRCWGDPEEYGGTAYSRSALGPFWPRETTFGILVRYPFDVKRGDWKPGRQKAGQIHACRKLRLPHRYPPSSQDADLPSLNLPPQIRPQRERAVLVQLLVTSPSHWIPHPLDFNLSAKLQSFPIADVRHHELCLPNLSRQRITGVQATARERLPVRALHRHPQHARHARNAIIGEANNQSQGTPILVAPDERRPHPIANAPVDPVERRRISLVVVRQILCADLVKVPQRPVIRADIHHMINHVSRGRDPFMSGARIGRLARQPLFEQCRDPWRTVAERFNLLVLNEDGVAANPVVAAHRAVDQF